MMAALGGSASPHYRTARTNGQHRSRRGRTLSRWPAARCWAHSGHSSGRSRSGGRGTAPWSCRTGSPSRCSAPAPCPGSCRHTLEKNHPVSRAYRGPLRKYTDSAKASYIKQRPLSLSRFQPGNANKKRKEWRGLKKKNSKTVVLLLMMFHTALTFPRQTCKMAGKYFQKYLI